jgi:hypothetical protein
LKYHGFKKTNLLELFTHLRLLLKKKKKKEIYSGLGVVAHSINLAIRWLKQEDCEFKASLGYIARPCLKKTKIKQKLHPVLISFD